MEDAELPAEFDCTNWFRSFTAVSRRDDRMEVWCA
jgi:hypothetical protein